MTDKEILEAVTGRPVDPRMVKWIENIALLMAGHPEEFEVIKAEFGQVSSTLTIQTYLPKKVLPK